MDHPILSIDEFRRHFLMQAQDRGYEEVDLLDMRPLQSATWPCTRAAFGVVISGEATVGNWVESQVCCTAETFELHDAKGLYVCSGPDGVRLLLARLKPLTLASANAVPVPPVPRSVQPAVD